MRIERMEADARKAAGMIRDAGSVLVVSHIDADGITAGSIAATTLARLGKPYRIRFEKKMSEDTVSMINGAPEDLVWICDLGSGYLSDFSRPGIVVTDHHVPDPRWRRKQTVLDDFEDVCHVNPHVYGMDGSREVCGAGMTYVVSKAVDPANADLCYLAIVGACGDFQDSDESRLVGYNRVILAEAEGLGLVLSEEDVRLFGRETRNLVQFLQYSGDPVLPGLTENGAGCADFLAGLGISLGDGGRRRSWCDLDDAERERATSALLELAGTPEAARRLFGEVYSVTMHRKGSGLRDAKEFATLLNSCGRYDDAETGMRICMGDPSALRDAKRNRAEHRRNISYALSYVKDRRLIRERRFIQYFDSGDEIRETVVGIVAGMMLNSDSARRDLPMLAFADADDGTKVSVRADRSLIERGLNLSSVMSTAAGLVGGYGGGHNVAAGATIPPDRKEEFLDIVEDIISSQLI